MARCSAIHTLFNAADLGIDTKMMQHLAFRATSAFRGIVLALACSLCMAAPVQAANQQDEQAAARKNVEQGGAMSIRKIEAIVLPKMRDMRYVGFTYHPVENVYLLRFMNGPKVVDVEVDAKTGRILWRSR